eukprot:3638635-Prymnesium_polylepis.1
MEGEQFKVRKVNRGGRVMHEVQTGANAFITVDVDEQGYLYHESSSSESTSSGSEQSELSSDDKQQFEAGYSRPH